jgi:hypothetical protein
VDLAAARAEAVAASVVDLAIAGSSTSSPAQIPPPWWTSLPPRVGAG